MNKSDHMKLLLPTFISMLWLACSDAFAIDGPIAHAKPNIIFILADDLGQRDLGCYGSSFYETPNLDRLAKDGALFTDAYAACPVCSPTRASLMTGQWPQRLGINDYIGAPLTPGQWNRNTKMLPAAYNDRLLLESPTLANGRFAARNKSASTP